MNDIHFAQKLKKTRNDLAITQKQLADRLHVSRKTVSGWETGRNRPDIDTLRQMAVIYHISLDELISDKKMPEKPKPEQLKKPVRKPEVPKQRLTNTLLNMILAILIIERLTQDTTHYSVFILLDWVIVFSMILRILSGRLGRKVTVSVQSPFFLISYFLFVTIVILSGVINLFDMGFVFQFFLVIVGAMGSINILIILWQLTFNHHSKH